MEALKEKEFIADSEIAWEDLGGGLKRKIMAYDANLMMVKVAFETGGIGTLHSHFHTQMSYVESGEFEITIGERKQVLRQGDVYYIPPHVVHGALCLSAGMLVDIFTPMREDFVSIPKV
ncbi:MAG: cupin domain-containing protein [Dyadobacter sp.]|uniref:cupin domain-containing protein n=1 Tax=Dyadobacter sp. TaxID=1914288 RepID=UPI001B1382DB|nr:cupin domain-containing protein [Dyadobacter sp.]MBO9612340.1 cupin domain-containing protein [Dyadobacter sp.]